MSSNNTILEQSQAITLKPHGRNYVYAVFLGFPPLTSEENPVLSTIFPIAKWLKEKIAPLITSTQDQLKQTKNKKENANSIVTCFYFSGHGLVRLGYSNDNITRKKEVFLEKLPKGEFEFESRPETPETTPHPKVPTSIKYWQDLYNEDIAKALKDKHETWESPYKERLDGLMIMAGNDHNEIEKEIRKINESLKKIGGKILHTDIGKRLTYEVNGKRIDVEPFGYRDGITKIDFFEKNNKGEPILKSDDRWKLALDGNYGTFLVFRKLEQDVPLFYEKVDELKNKLGVSQAFAEAQIMGRFKDGTPLVLYDDYLKEKDKKKINEFDNYFLNPLDKNIKKIESDYEKYDSTGLKCPLHAHIRKANPRRTKAKGEDIDHSVRHPKPIIRRSIPYDCAHTGKVGLLFMCYQRDIRSQFIKIQENWLNDKVASYDDALEANGLDPIAGQTYKSKDLGQKWIQKWGKENSKQVQFDFSKVVTFRGGGFFYGPPKKFFDDPIDIQYLERIFDKEPV